jgi:uncharacterized membrane protein YfcA
MWWELILSGLLVGALVGLTGMGGGSLMTPLLVIAFGFNPTTAVGTDIAHGAIFKTVGAIRHRRLGTVHARLSGWMFMTSAPMSLLGVWLATKLKGFSGSMAVIIGIALVLGGVGLMAKSFIRFQEHSNAGFRLTRRDRIAALAIGLCGGLIVGLTSVGTGVFFGLTMLIVFPLRAAKIVGTDIFHAAALLYVAGFGHFIAGNVDFGTVGWLLIGSIPGVLLSSQFTLRLPDRALRVALATVLAMSGIKLAEPPATNPLLGLALAVGLSALAVVIVKPRLQKRVEHVATVRQT